MAAPHPQPLESEAGAPGSGAGFCMSSSATTIGTSDDYHIPSAGVQPA